MRYKISVSKYIKIGMLLIIILLNAITFSPKVCDWYVEKVFPIWINTMGRFCSLFPFSVGEWMIMLGVVLLLVALLGNGYYLLYKKKSGQQEKGKWIKKYNAIFLDILLVVLLLLTLNWTMINRCTPIMESDREFQIAELEMLRNTLVVTANSMATTIERNDDNTVKFELDVQKEAENALHKLAIRYPRLAGYYPRMKPMMFSDLMSQSWMAGYYFPFSMEGNYNKVMYEMNYPECYCHELSHIKGYMLEDEANFLSYLACIGSDNEVFRYSGVLSVLYYVDNAFYSSVGAEYYMTRPQISKQVKIDNQFLTPEAMEKVEQKAVISSETVKKASDAFNDATIKMGGVPDGMASYDRVTELLLCYYFPETEAVGQ